MIKIILVDDHSILREGLKEILSTQADFEVVGEAANQSQLLPLLNLEWDLLILDIGLPGANGLEILKSIKKDYPQKQVLILSMYPEDQYALRALKAGASGYLVKECAGEELVTAIRKISMGEKYLRKENAEQLIFSLLKDDTEDPHQKLSDREFEVIQLIASGKTLSEIAEQLSLSVKTVSTYRSRILEKMNLKGNAELTRYAFEKKIVQ